MAIYGIFEYTVLSGGPNDAVDKPAATLTTWE